MTRLGRVTRLSLQSLNGHLHLLCKLDQIKMTNYVDRRVTHLHVNRSLNCVLEVVQCIHAFNKSGRHLGFFINDVIRGKTSAGHP